MAVANPGVENPQTYVVGKNHGETRWLSRIRNIAEATPSRLIPQSIVYNGFVPDGTLTDKGHAVFAFRPAEHNLLRLDITPQPRASLRDFVIRTSLKRATPYIPQSPFPFGRWIEPPSEPVYEIAAQRQAVAQNEGPLKRIIGFRNALNLFKHPGRWKHQAESMREDAGDHFPDFLNEIWMHKAVDIANCDGYPLPVAFDNKRLLPFRYLFNPYRKLFPK